MLPYFNDCRRKQPLPKAMCKKENGCCKPFAPIGPWGFHPEPSSPHAGGHLRAHLQVVLGDVLRWLLAWCQDEWRRVILARIQSFSHSSTLEGTNSKFTVKWWPKWKTWRFGEKRSEKSERNFPGKKCNIAGKKRNSPSVDFDLVWRWLVVLDKHWEKLEFILVWPFQGCRVQYDAP